MHAIGGSSRERRPQPKPEPEVIAAGGSWTAHACVMRDRHRTSSWYKAIQRGALEVSDSQMA